MIQRARAIVLIGGLVAAATWLGTAAPAGAALNVTATGTVVTGTLTGDLDLAMDISCFGGTVRVGGMASTPSVACSAVTKVRIFADDGGQLADVSGASAAAFTALTNTEVSLGDGNDSVITSTKADDIATGAGNDVVTSTVHTGGFLPNDVDMGADQDRAVIVGRATADDVVLLDMAVLAVAVGNWRTDHVGVESLRVELGDGDDGFDGTFYDAPDAMSLWVDGGAGADELSAGDDGTTLIGGTGANVLQGGSDQDTLISSSTADTIIGGGGTDRIVDSGTGAVGRTIIGAASRIDSWAVELTGWTAIRSRGGPGTADVLVALGRTGRQDLADDFTFAEYDGGSIAAERSIFDLEAVPGMQQRALDDHGTGDVVDIVVPTGTWSTLENGPYTQVTFSAGYGTIQYRTASQAVIRAPFTGAERWAHRVLRDLLWRIPTDGDRLALAFQLSGGSAIVRRMLVGGFTDGDVYRGLTVDRAFVDILRRGVDSGGRAYWIDRLDSGLVVRKLRANLYGSPEYFTVHGGGTNASYVAAAYRDILGRTAGSSEVAYWVDQIEDVGLPRGTIADRFLNTPEARLVVIRDLFLRWADREPTAGEVSTWSTQLASSSTDGELALVRSLAASDAYFNRPDA